MRYPERLHIAIDLNRHSKESLQVQISEQLQAAIVRGYLRAGSRVPSTRALAHALKVSRSVTLAAYERLFAAGYLEPRQGSGTYVASDRAKPVLEPQDRIRLNVRTLQDSSIDDLSLGRPSLERFPLAAWRSAWRHASYRAPVQTGPPRAGVVELRRAIADYLVRSRGLRCSAEQIFITSGIGHALDLLARVVVDDGPVGIENPGSHVARHIFQSRGAMITPLRVSSQGVLLDDANEHISAILVTPSNYYLSGPQMSILGREEILTGAAAQGALVIELDHDHEFRIMDPPLPTLRSLGESAQTAYVGSFCHILAPSLRVGYIVADETLVARMEGVVRLTEEHPPWTAQHAMNHLLRRGQLALHVARMNRIYARKREILIASLRGAEIARLSLPGGLRGILELDGRLPASILSDELRNSGLRVQTLDNYYVTGTCDRNGIALGYGHLDDESLGRYAGLISDAIRRSISAA